MAPPQHRPRMAPILAPALRRRLTLNLIRPPVRGYSLLAVIARSRGRFRAAVNIGAVRPRIRDGDRCNFHWECSRALGSEIRWATWDRPEIRPTWPDLARAVNGVVPLDSRFP